MSDILDRLRAEADWCDCGAIARQPHQPQCRSNTLRDAIAAIEQRDAEISRLREQLQATAYVLDRFAVWQDNDIQGLRYHASVEARDARAALAAQREETNGR